MRYFDDISRVLKSQGIRLSEGAVEDLARSGLTGKTVRRMNILPLTPETFKEYTYRSLIEKSTREPIVKDGYVIPYPGLPKFGRVKVLEWGKGSRYYQERKGELPKYLQPSKEHVENPLRLYYLSDAEGRISSPKGVFVITEGEKKTAKLQQELEKLEGDLPVKFAALGLGGVWNWNPGLFKGIPLRDRVVFLSFDSDSAVETEFGEVGNVNVARAELTLYSFLLSKGAKVKSLVWDYRKGKGIDDYLVAREGEGKSPEGVLRELLKKAVSPIEKFKGIVSPETVLECLAEYLTEIPTEVLDAVKKAYGGDKRKIRKRFSEIVKKKRKEIEESLTEDEQEVIKSFYQRYFGIDFVPVLPDGAERKGELLYYNGELITRFFVVARLYENVDTLDNGYAVVLKFMDGKEVRIVEKAIASYKILAEVLNKAKVPISESGARKLTSYISQFVNLNYHKIPKSYFSTRIGWGDVEGEEIYVHPETSDVEAVITGDVEEKLRAEGERDVELEIVREIFRISPYAGFIYAVCVSSSMVYPLLKKDCNVVCLVQGESGSGKTTAISGGVSFFASPSLKRSFNTTEGGFEMLVSKLKDFPLHFEEIRDLDSNPVRRVEKFVKFVYQFVEGEGRTRLSIDLSFRPVARMRGIVLTSSEIGIDEILSKSADSYRDGLKRRLLVIPVSREKLKGALLAKTVDKLYRHHGNLLKEWIEHVRVNLPEIEKRFSEIEQDFLEGYRLDPKLSRFLAVVAVVLEELEKLFGIPVEECFDVLEEVGSFNEKVYSGDEGLKERIEEKIIELVNETCVEEEDIYGKVRKVLKEPKGDFSVYRRIRFEAAEEDREIEESRTFLTARGIERLAELIGIGKRILISKMIDLGLLEEDRESGKAKRVKLTVAMVGSKVNLYPVNLSSDVSKETVLEEIQEF